MSDDPIRLTTPLGDEDVVALKAGDRVLITGTLFTARDAAHKRLCECLERGEELPIVLRGQIIYYVGPTPPKPGQVIGSAGPTTAYRMDAFTPTMLEQGMKAAIGKGSRSAEVVEALKRHKAVYFGATGGAAALLAKRIEAAEVVAYEDLGPEAIRKLTVRDFPAVVVNDAHGADFYRQGVEEFLRQSASCP